MGRPRTLGYASPVARILLVTDADRILDEVEAAVGGEHELFRAWAGAEVLGAVGQVHPDLVLLDLQIGNMGGMATCLDLRLEARAGRIEPVKVLMLLDRDADVFLARRAEADGWLVKPLTSLALRRAVRGALEPTGDAESTADTVDA